MTVLKQIGTEIRNSVHLSNKATAGQITGNSYLKSNILPVGICIVRSLLRIGKLDRLRGRQYRIKRMTHNRGK